jgi:hypothetical protein
VEAVVTTALRGHPWECIVIGGGVRHQPELFEKAVNLVRLHAPQASIAFNATRPTHTTQPPAGSRLPGNRFCSERALSQGDP